MFGADARRVVDALGWTLLDFLWQGLLICAVYAVLRGLLGHRRANARLLSGYVALLALAVAPVVTLLGHLQAGAGAAAAGGLAAIGEPTLRVVATLSDGASLGSWLDVLVAAWASGVLLLALQALREWLQLRRICREALPLPTAWQLMLDRLVIAFRARRPRLLESARVTAPLVVGWIRPVILLPAGLCLRLPAAQLELLLAHELAHIRRLDFLVNLLQIAVETILFYHPAVHWISRRVREDRELCCDDMVATVCDARVEYARALLAVAEQRSATPRMALAATAGQLLLRVERIVDVAEPRRAAPAGRPLFAPLMLGIAVLVMLAIRDRHQQLPAIPLPPILTQPLQLAAPALGVDSAMPMIELLSTSVAPTPAVPLEQARSASPAPIEPMQRSRPALPTLQVAVPDGRAAIEPAARSALVSAAAPVAVAPSYIVEPVYPEFARIRGVEGEAVLSYRIERGRAADVRIERESHAGMFAVAAERALAQWRFPDADPVARQRHVFEFRLADGADSGRDCSTPTGSRICRPAR